MPTRPNYPGIYVPVCARIQDSDTTAKVAIASATNSTTPRRITSLFASSTDTSNKDVIFYLYDGTIDVLICTISILLNSGNTNAIAPINLLNHPYWGVYETDMAGNRVLIIPKNGALKAAAGTTLTSGKIIGFTGGGQDLS